MNYNLAENSNLYTDDLVGNVLFSPSDIVDTVNLVGSFYLSGDDVLCLECDLGSRIKTEQIRYYFSSTEASGTVSSSIEFYYKNDSVDSYSLLDTNIGAGFYYTTVSSTSAPRYVRLIHTINGTSVSGTVVGFSIYNEDDTVDFGSDGTTESFVASTSVLGGSDEIKTIPIYNDGPIKATAYVIVEPQGTDVDELVTISTTSGGPWVGVKENAQIIADENSWAEDGDLSSTVEISSGMLQLEQNEMVGTYTTKIFGGASKNNFVHLDIYSEPGDTFITKDSNREIRTMETRSSSQKPKDYAICRTFTYGTSGGYRWLYYIDKHRDDGSTVYTSGYLSDGSNTSYDYYVRCASTDPITGKTAGFVYRTRSGYDWRQLRAFIITETGDYSDIVWLQRDTSTAISNNCYDIVWDGDGGVWWLVYADYYRTGYTLNQGAGYYLMHFSPGFTTQTYKGFSVARQCHYMSAVQSNGYLWYTDRNTKFVKLITQTGTELVQRSDLNAYGVSATSDGGCWYISGTNLIHLSSGGVLIETLENIGSTSLRGILMDGDDAMYLRDGDYIKRVLIDGTEVFSTYVALSDKMLGVTDTGVWVRTTGNTIRFVTSAGELKSTSIGYSYLPAVIEYAYDTDGHDFHFPISTDNHWNSLVWQEVRPDSYHIPIGDKYTQARITMRSNAPADIYAVDSTDSWTPNDSFTQADATGPKEHRWVASDNSSAIGIVSNRLRFYGGVGGDKDIRSQNSWYIDTGGTKDIDIQLYYRLPGTWDPPPVQYSLYLRLYSLDPAYAGYYAEAIMQRYNNAGAGYNRLYMRVYNGTTNGTFSIYDSTYNYGYIRIHLDRTNNRWRSYDYINASWPSQTLTSASSYPIGNTFYMYIYTPDHGAGNHIEIDDVVFNQNIGDVIFYDWETPQLQNIYLQKSIEIPDIYPGTAKNAYMKLSLPDQSMDWVGSRSTNLKVWFEVPTNV